MSNIKEIANILQTGMDMVGGLVKEKSQIKIERAKYDMEMQKKKTEFGLTAGKNAVEAGKEIIVNTVEVMVDNQTKKTDALVKKSETDNKIREAVAETDNEIKRNKADEELNEQRIRFENEMEELAKDRDLQRRKNVLEAIQKYQIEVTKTVNESMMLMAVMPVDVQEKVENMLREERERYFKLQSEWADDAEEKIERIEKSFANNERMKNRLQDSIWNEAERMIQMATKTVERMEEDVKRINDNAIRFSVEEVEILGMEMLNGREQYLIQTDKSE